MPRFLIASDIHGSPRALEALPRYEALVRPDAVVLCGDITHFRKPSGYAGRLVRSFRAPVAAIPGNCDPPEMVEELSEAGAASIHGRRTTVAGSAFVGFGGGRPGMFGGLFNTPDDEVERRLDALLAGPDDILVVHVPAKGALDRMFLGLHVGSDGVARLVARRRPRLVLSGHIHEARGVLAREGTLFVNPGPGKSGCAAVVEVDGEGTPRASLIG